LVTPRFTDNGNGTVTDNQTGLIWLKNADCFGRKTWLEALSDCNGLAAGSCEVTDFSQAGNWMLPNRKELFSLVHDGYYTPALPNTLGTGQWTENDPFANVQYGFALYWSSNTYASSDAWLVSMEDGDINASSKISPFSVWCVRGGH
jgi:hypothetical protein